MRLWEIQHNLWKWAPIIINSRQLARSTIVLRAAKRQLLFLNLLWFLCVTQTIAVWWYYHHGRKDSWGFSDALAYLAGWLTGRLVELKIVSFNLYRLEWCLVTFGPIFILVYSEVLKTQEEKIVFVLFIDMTICRKAQQRVRWPDQWSMIISYSCFIRCCGQLLI